jgi:signal transduction histidine kinase
MRLSIRKKLLLIIAGSLCIVLATHTFLQMNLQKKAFDHELQQRTLLMRENLQQRALSQAETLKHLIAEYIAAYQLFELSHTVKQTADETDDLVKVIVVDKLNQVYVDSSKPAYSGFYIPEPDIDHRLKQNQFPSGQNKQEYNENYLGAYKIREVQVQGFEGLEFKIPIEVGQDVWGFLILIYSLSELNTQIMASTEANEMQQAQLNIKTLIISLSLLCLAYLAISMITKRLIAPIITLTNYTRDLAQGNFSHIEEISKPQDDELGILTQNFITMAKNLEQSQKTLESYNSTLEQKVEQRTYALNLKNSALKQALSDLEDSQQQLIYSEKMAALGQLIAGIAHEINTPLGAIQASAGNNSKSFKSFETKLPEYLSKVSDDDKYFLNILLQKSIAKISTGEIFSTREERQQKKQIQSFLDELNIDNADEITELLLDMINVSDLSDLAPYLRNKNALHVIDLAHCLSALERNNHTILTAVSKASKVVFSLKNFSRHDIAGKKILSNINYGIQTVLVLYQNFLKQGCTVVENYSELPDILCYPDELNQVWTNLIHNALYAMENVGTLTIETFLENNSIIVKITDDGAGIQEDIQEKVFTSFFTTKPAGEGSGLGLGICKRIIDKHEGDISLISEPGKTTFTVTLPILEQ